MKKRNSNSLMGLALMSLLLITFTPNDTFAQRAQREKEIYAQSSNEAKRKNSKKRSKTKKQKVTTPVKQYKKQPRRGAQVTSLPRKTVVVNHRNSNYHYRDGIYYRPVNGSYVVTSPPIGIRVNVLPSNPFRVRLSGRVYFYYYGTFYTSLPSGGYEVVNPPLGAKVDALPDGYEVFELEGFVYYRLDETYYKAVLEPNGNVVYEVVRV